MSVRQILKRLETLEKVHSHQDGTILLEDLFRAIWRRDKQHYLELVRTGKATGCLVTQFEQEDAERERSPQGRFHR